MTVNEEALAAVLDAQAMGRRVQDEHTREMVSAWARSWDTLAAEFAASLESVMLDAKDGRVTAAQMRKATRLAKALDAAHTQLQLLAQQSQDFTIEALPEQVEAVVVANTAAMEAQLPAGTGTVKVTDVVRTSPEALAAIVTRTTGQIEAKHAALPDDVVDIMRRELIRGVATGTNPRRTAARMVDRARGRFNGGLTRALGISRTETMEALRTASQASDDANADILRGWQWIASLDRKLCPGCLVMHGTEHKLSEPGPAGHQCCRCTRAPITKTWAELGIPGVEDVVSAVPDGREWFDNLEPASQAAIMGPARLALYQSGDVGWDQFATVRPNAAWRDSIVPTPVKALV